MAKNAPAKKKKPWLWIMLGGLTGCVVLTLGSLVLVAAIFAPKTKEEIKPLDINYATYEKDCMSTQFVKGYKAETGIDYYDAKDSCAFNLSYEGDGNFASLRLDSPLVLLSGPCKDSKDIYKRKGNIEGAKVVQERETEVGGLEAYKVVTELGGAQFVDYYVCFGRPTYKWGSSKVDGLVITGTFNEGFQRQVSDHAISKWKWK